jgi:mannosyltransferase
VRRRGNPAHVRPKQVKPRMHRRNPLWPALLVLAAFAVRAITVDAQSLWRDEVDALRFASVPLDELIHNFARKGWNGPLYFLLLRGWVTVAGATPYVLRFPSVLLGVLCVPLSYALACRLVGRAVATLTAAMVAGSAYLVWYSQEVKMYTLVPALALVALYVLRRGVDQGTWYWWVVLVAATSAAFYSHILAALLVPVEVLAYFAWWPRSRKRWIAGVWSLAALVLPYAPLGVWQLPLLAVQRETGFQPYTLGGMVEVLSNGWSAGILAKGGWLAAPLVAGLAVLGLLRPPMRGRSGVLRSDRWMLAAWVVVPLLLVWGVSLRQPLFTDRYLVWTAPAFLMLASMGIVSMCEIGHAMCVPAVLLLAVLSGVSAANLRAQATVPIKADFREAADYVYARYLDERTGDRSLRPGPRSGPSTSRVFLPMVVHDSLEFGEMVVFQIPYARHTFDYYFEPTTYPWADGLYTNHRATDGSYLMASAEAEWRMRQLAAGHDVVWLVLSESAMWDERGLVKAWLDKNMRLEQEAHFTLVDVYRYRR